MAMGAVLVPLDKDWGALELTDTVKTADTSVIVCDKEQKAKVAEICEATGETPSNVRQILSRTRKKMIEMFKVRF